MISLAEARFLVAHTGQFADLELPTDPLKRVATLTTRFGEYGRAVAELLDARSKGKLPATWLMDSDSSQQATPLAVSEVRFERIRRVLGQCTVHDVTCSIGTEGVASMAAGLRYFGSDLSLPRLVMAQHNVPEASFFQADALQPCITADVVVADPARRAGGRRITNPADLLPPLPALLDAHNGPLAVKCAPGLDFSEWDGLVSLVSVNGGVKEACLYTPELAEGASREAVVIRGSIDRLTDLLPTQTELAGPHGSYLIDPDGAVVRAGLVRHFAVREGLWMLDERIAYLTGDRIPAGYTGFKILEQVPLKKLKSALAPYDVGALEILVRGVDVDPDALRKKLRLRGKQAMAVVVTRIGSQGVALICEARSCMIEG
ncbi:SAM-dependent methyltransferase [Corynebacterium sp. H128]|uniref:THUMP-like domain-containing protein n=1 Tax=unclassified Corynebacterium TaxID=2624378 RepID=UPI0030A90362